MDKNKLLLISDDEHGKFILNESARRIGKDCLFDSVTHILAGDNWRYIDYDGEKGFIDDLHNLYQTDEENFDNLYSFIEFVYSESLMLEYYEISHNSGLIHESMNMVIREYEFLGI